MATKESGVVTRSEKVKGDRGNYRWPVEFDETDGYIGINQDDEHAKLKERVLLSPKLRTENAALRRLIERAADLLDVLGKSDEGIVIPGESVPSVRSLAARLRDALIALSSSSRRSRPRNGRTISRGANDGRTR